jgi:hypothetical protein
MVKMFNYKDIAELYCSNVTTIQQKMKEYTPVMVAKNGMRFFSQEQVQIFLDEN